MSPRVSSLVDTASATPAPAAARAAAPSAGEAAGLSSEETGSPDGVAGGPPTFGRERRRRTFLRAFLRALTDPATFDVRSNPSVWLGALLAIPIPVLLVFAHAPTWIELASFVAPVG